MPDGVWRAIAVWALTVAMFGSIGVMAIVLLDGDLGRFGGPGSIGHDIARAHRFVMRELGVL
jgi:hypothetical protein